jgi:hypothetical protein
MGGENAMKLTMSILCFTGVIFLLRVLAALVKDSRSFPRPTKRASLAKVHPPRERRGLILSIRRYPTLEVRPRKFSNEIDQL